MRTCHGSAAIWVALLSPVLAACGGDGPPSDGAAGPTSGSVSGGSGAILGTTSGVGTSGNVDTTSGVGPTGDPSSSGSVGPTGDSNTMGSVGTTGDASSTSGFGGSGGATTTSGSGGSGGSPTSVSFKPRVIHTTDLGGDPDDQESMVRQLAMANWFDIEGLVVTTGCWKKSQSDTAMLDAIVDAYGQTVATLQVHDPEFPSVEYLRSISVMGQTGYGMGDVGEGKDSPGSELIIASVDKDDERPLWATCWGGCNTIAQALWKVQNTRSAEELARFVSKLRVYDILGQDDAGTWIAKTFQDMTYIRATGVYSWQPSESWVAEHVRSHGALGAAYPEKEWDYEGDSPAIFHLIPNGLHDPDKVDQGGWGGLFASQKQTGIRGMSCMEGEDAPYDPYAMYNDTTESISRWKNAIQNDFESRMDWSITSNYADANHHPIAIVNGDTSRQVMEVSAAAGSSIEFDAAGSSDPDGNELSYSWWVFEASSSYTGSVTIQGNSSASATAEAPSDAGGQKIHVILELSDDGSPSLTAYRRVILDVQ